MLFVFPALILIGVGLAQRPPMGVGLGLLALLPVSWYLLATPYGRLAVCLLFFASAGIVAALSKDYEGVAWAHKGRFFVHTAIVAGLPPSWIR